jgi:hypothetical protein
MFGLLGAFVTMAAIGVVAIGFAYFVKAFIRLSHSFERQTKSVEDIALTFRSRSIRQP